METKDLMIAYKAVIWASEQNTRASYNQSFMVVKNWLANEICNRLDEGKIIETLETFNKV